MMRSAGRIGGRLNSRMYIALLTSALVGVAAGASVGMMTSRAGVGRAAGPTSTRTSSSAKPTSQDPLQLGAELENLPCTGQTILVIGWGDRDERGALTNAVSSTSGDARYLETRRSCDTLYAATRRPTPDYAAYLGPFDSIAEPCSLRMSIDHARDEVTTLKAGVRIHVQCLCVLRPDEFPILAVGMHPDTRDGIYIRALQRLLADIGRNPRRRLTGRYDTMTRAMVVPLQRLNALDPRVYGIVEQQTWRLLRDRACITYDF